MPTTTRASLERFMGFFLLCSGQPTEKRRSGLATDTLIRVPASMPRKRKGCHGVLPYLTFHEQRTVVPRYTDRWNSGEINRPRSLWPEKLVSFAGSWAHSADYTRNVATTVVEQRPWLLGRRTGRHLALPLTDCFDSRSGPQGRRLVESRP